MYNSEFVNDYSDSLDHFEPVVILRWKDDYYRRERRKKIASFVFSLLLVSGFVAFFWTYREQMRRREVRNIVRSRVALHEFARESAALVLETSTSEALYQKMSVPVSSEDMNPNPTTTSPLVMKSSTLAEILDQKSSSIPSNRESAETYPSSPFCPERTVGYYSGSGTREIPENQILKLTHIIFSHLKLHLNGTISFRRENEKRRFLDLKKKVKGTNVKLMVSIEEDGVDFQFSEVSRDAEKRRFFIENISTFLQDYSIDGVDIAWMHPWPADSKNLIQFFRELHDHLKQLSEDTQHPYIISLVAPPLGKPQANDLGENFLNILEYIDFVNVKSLDYWKFWRRHTGPFAPLYSGVGKERKPSLNDTISYYVRKTGGTEKLNLGVAFHGTYWNNVVDGNGLWNPVQMIKGHMERGNVAWRNFENWNRSLAEWDEESRTPYIRDKENGKLLSFENKRSLGKKMDFVNELNLGGVAIWSLEMDDDTSTLLGAVSSCGYNQ